LWGRLFDTLGSKLPVFTRRKSFIMFSIQTAGETAKESKMRKNKVKGYAPNGGTVTIETLERGTSGGAKDLSQTEFDAYKKARLTADPANGGDIEKAKSILEKAGFDVYWSD
jgi:hypothetical protein